MATTASALRIHVHDNTRVLDGMLRLVELARQERPLDDTLSAMCRQIAETVGVDVVSVYLVETHGVRDLLVMRANVGFPADAVGRVQLEMDEGLTGVVAQRRRPVTVAIAQDDDRYKHVDGIGEEQFATYVGVPLLVGGDVAGVLVCQRRSPGAFTESDVALASSLTGPLIFAIERSARARRPSSVGTSVVRARAIGPALVVPPPSASPTSQIAALHALEFDLVTAAQRLGHGGPPVARALDNLGLVAIALRDAVATGDRRDVLTRLARAPYCSMSGSKDLSVVMAERQREVHDLWGFLLSDMQHRLAICGAVLVVESLGTFLALEAVARGAAAIVIGGAAETGAHHILEAAQLPAVAGVPELVARMQCGDMVEVDGIRGTVAIIHQKRRPESSR